VKLASFPATAGGKEPVITPPPGKGKDPIWESSRYRAKLSGWGSTYPQKDPPPLPPLKL